MTIAQEQNITQFAPVRIGLEFEYDYQAGKWVIKNIALADMRFYNANGDLRANQGASLTIPPALLAANQSAWDSRLAQFLGAGGEGEGLTVYVPPVEEV